LAGLKQTIKAKRIKKETPDKIISKFASSWASARINREIITTAGTSRMTAKKHLSGLLKEYRITVATDTTTYIQNISPKNSTVPLSLDAKTGKLTKKKQKISVGYGVS
jgi:uncharacterized membrane protein YkoI